jgi:hypothetical protein
VGFWLPKACVAALVALCLEPRVVMAQDSAVERFNQRTADIKLIEAQAAVTGVRLRLLGEANDILTQCLKTVPRDYGCFATWQTIERAGANLEGIGLLLHAMRMVPSEMRSKFWTDILDPKLESTLREVRVHGELLPHLVAASSNEVVVPRGTSAVAIIRTLPTLIQQITQLR